MFADKHNKNSSMDNNKEIGDFGENLALKFLIKKGFKIINKNFRIGFDEIDIIALDMDGTLVFIEVKTKRDKSGRGMVFMPEDHMTQSKMRRFTRACQKFSDTHPALVNEEKGWRMDLVAIVLGKNKATVRHYKNI